MMQQKQHQQQQEHQEHRVPCVMVQSWCGQIVRSCYSGDDTSTTTIRAAGTPHG